MYNKVGILPSCWGSSMWFSLHSIAYAYNPQIDKENYYSFFSNLGNILPCEECRFHYYQNLNKKELITALESAENMFKWVYDLHNKVNLQTGVPPNKWPSYESVKEKYSTFKASCAYTPGTCGPGTGKMKRMKIVEQFDNINEDQIPLIAVIAVLSLFIFMLICYIMYLKKK